MPNSTTASLPSLRNFDIANNFDLSLPSPKQPEGTFCRRSLDSGVLPSRYTLVTTHQATFTPPLSCFPTMAALEQGNQPIEATVTVRLVIAPLFGPAMLHKVSLPATTSRGDAMIAIVRIHDLHVPKFVRFVEWLFVKDVVAVVDIAPVGPPALACRALLQGIKGPCSSRIS